MDENLINQIAENDELDDVIIQDVDIPMQDVIPEIVTEEIIDDISITTDDIEIDISESMGWVTGDNRYHNSLLGIDAPNQHPITAITGLRDELDEIEALKTVFSNQNNHADYYLWRHENAIPNEPDGLFVSFYPSTNSIQVCSDTDDIFGVTVKSAGFIGGQNDIPRDNKYGLVVCAGVVSVRCELDVVTGDSVVSNSYGYAKKAEGGYGYKVISVQKIDGVTYATIPLGISVNQVNDLMIEFDAFDTRVNKVETDIVAAINVAQQAYNKAGEANSVSQEALKEALDAVLKSDEIVDKNKDLENIVTSTNQVAVQAKAIAESAVTTAESIRLDAEKAANDTLASVNDLIEDLEPITTWSYTDPATGKQYEGAEYLANYIKDDLATKAEVYTVESLTEENKSLIEKNAESFTTFVSSVDKYSVGEYSQSYGLTREQAMSILKNGTIYVPTKHKDSDSHSETFVGESEKQWFTPGSHYKWDGNDWIEYGNSVAFGINEPSYTSQLQYWYIDSNEDPDGYKSHALYTNIDGEWTKVNILDGNVTNRIVSDIRQTANEISLEITNARGSTASLSERLDDEKAEIASLTAWRTGDNTEQENASIIRQVSDDNGASVVIAALQRDEDEIKEMASLTLTVDKSKSILSLSSDNIVFTSNTYDVIANGINLKGYVTISGVENGTTTINGECIKTGAIQSNNYVKDKSGMKLSLLYGTWDSTNFKIDTDGNVEMSGKITATSGTIGDGDKAWNIGTGSIHSGKESLYGTDDGIYIGVDGINVGDGFIVDANGNVQIKNGITGITKTIFLYYASKTQTTPATPSYDGTDLTTDWSLTPVGVSNTYPYVYVSQCTIDGDKYVCSAPQLWASKGADGKDGADGSDAEVDSETIFKLLTGDGERFGCFVDPNNSNSMYINANYVCVGDVDLNGDGLSIGDCFIKSEDEATLNVNGAMIQDGSIAADKIVAKSITSDQIKAGSISAECLKANSITSDQIKAGSISADRLATNSITTDQLDVDKITLGGWSITDKGFRSYNDDNVYMYASGLLGCQRIVVNDVSLAGVMDLNDYSNINTPITKGMGGLDAYLDNLRARIAALEKHTNVGHKVHTYSQLTSRTPATCTATGSETYKCSCGATTTKTLLKLPHEWNANGICIVCKTERTTETCEHPTWKMLERQEPKCDKDGYEILECTECGYIPPQITLPAGHSWVNEDGECWRCGKKCEHEFDGGVICTICGYNELHSQHTYVVTSYEQSEDSEYHRATFTCRCGATYQGSPQPCEYNEDGVCACGRSKCITHEYSEPSYNTDGYSGYHTPVYTCNICGYEHWGDEEECECETNYSNDCAEGLHIVIKTCTKCGATYDSGAVECTYENGSCICGRVEP